MKSHFHKTNTPTQATPKSILFFCLYVYLFPTLASIYVYVRNLDLDNKYMHILSNAVHNPYNLFGENIP